MSALKCLYSLPHTSLFRFFPCDHSGVHRSWRCHRPNQGRGSWRWTQRRDGVQHRWRSRHVQHRNGPKYTGGNHRDQKGFLHSVKRLSWHIVHQHWLMDILLEKTFRLQLLETSTEEKTFSTQSTFLRLNLFSPPVLLCAFSFNYMTQRHHSAQKPV